MSQVLGCKPQNLIGTNRSRKGVCWEAIGDLTVTVTMLKNQPQEKGRKQGRQAQSGSCQGWACPGCCDCMVPSRDLTAALLHVWLLRSPGIIAFLPCSAVPLKFQSPAGERASDWHTLGHIPATKLLVDREREYLPSRVLGFASNHQSA